MLEVRDLTVEVDGKTILHDVNLTIKAGETHALLGPNGSGKTTLLMAIMGMPRRSAHHAIPELFAEKAPLSELSHEAAISPIAEEEVEYLMARGLSKEEAVSTITRGFLNIDIPGLPPILKGYIQVVLDAATKEAL